MKQVFTETMAEAIGDLAYDLAYVGITAVTVGPSVEVSYPGYGMIATATPVADGRVVVDMADGTTIVGSTRDIADAIIRRAHAMGAPVRLR